MTEPLAFPLRSSCRPLLAAIAAFCGMFALTGLPAAAADSDRTAYVLLSQDSRSASMSGSTDDLKRARALQAGRGALLYVRRGGEAYVIRDAATLSRAKAIFEPQEAMGARQAELGSRQAALGSRQAALGAQQARLGAQQANASPRRAIELGREQAALGRQQDELGRQQNALGARQGVLGREQARLAREADVKIQALLAEALRSGAAQRVD